MSGAFDDVTLIWRDREYTIPARNMMGAIARIEDHVTMPEMQRFGERGTAPISRLSAAFGSVLRFAGCQVKDEEVYSAMFEGGDAAIAVSTSIRTLLAMMVPKNARDKIMNKTEAELEDEAGKSQPAGMSTSRKRTNSRSGTPGSRRRNSGISRSKNSTGS